jgi:UDP:flavonoid glycosyltransferase YjiC (YdhE family)
VGRFLFTVWPFLGHLRPNEAIACVLTERGHEAAFYTGGSVRALLETEGLHCFPFRQVDEARIQRAISALDGLSLQWWRARRRKALLARMVARIGRCAARRSCGSASRLAA